MDVGRAYSSVSPVLIRLVLLKYWPTAANTMGSLIVVILSGREFQYIIVPGKKENLYQSLVVWVLLYACY